MAKFGGKQPGSGRPKGSTTKPRLSDYLTEKEINAIVKKAKELALAGNENMIKLITEQHFGKAIQPVEGDFKGEVILKFDNSFQCNYTNNSKTS
jgi:hypothetical protein